MGTSVLLFRERKHSFFECITLRTSFSFKFGNLDSNSETSL